MNEPGATQLTGRRRELLQGLPALRRFALSLTNDRERADDLLHATVARVLKRGLPIEAELIPWCIRVCKQIWMHESRSRESHVDPSASCREEMSKGAASPEPVQVALAHLSDEQRCVLELIAAEGYSYRAASAMLDMPIGRLMSRLVRARGTLIEQCCSDWPMPMELRAVNHD